jgi:ABC-type glycerol-3-phosphate transport system permease component
MTRKAILFLPPGIAWTLLFTVIPLLYTTRGLGNSIVITLLVGALTLLIAVPFASWILAEAFRRLSASQGDEPTGIAHLQRLLFSEAGRHALFAAFAVALSVGWQEFLFALILNSETGRAIMVEVAQRRAFATSFETTFPETAALSVLTGIVTALIVSLFARRYLARWID